MKKDKKWVLDKLNKIDPFAFGVEYRLGFEKGIKRAKTIVEKLDEPEKVVVPKFVDDFINSKEKENLDKWKMASSFISYIKYKKGSAYEWSQQKGNMDKFLSALVNNYEVEKEPLYYVKLPTTVWNDEASELEDSGFYLKLNITSNEIAFSNLSRRVGDWSGALTEKQIKDYDERFWPFAVEVEYE